MAVAESGVSTEHHRGPSGDEVVDPVMVLRGAHTSYRVYERRPHAVRGRTFRGRVARTVHAIRGVDLTVRAGESVAVIGHNGAGKSTLMRVIAGLQPLDSGTLQVASPPRMLGVQAMLNGAWSGRQTIETGLIALGLQRGEALGRIDDVAGFARLSEVIDLPVATYSSGMRSRLYFAISTEVGSDILLIDEALSAGDGRFRRAAQRRMRERLDESETLLLVSHSMSTIREFCERAVLLDQGRIIDDGPIGTVIEHYERLID